MDTLDKLFGSSARLKILKLFIFNPEIVFERGEIIKRVRAGRNSVGKELLLLQKIKFLKKKSFYKEGKLYKSGKRGPKKRTEGFYLNTLFPYITPLQRLLVSALPFEKKDLERRLSRGGRIKLVIISGIFIQNDDAVVDLLIVGDNLKERQLNNVISTIEAEIGKQLRYSILTTSDFKYRLGICDRLVRDILDYPHEVLVDKTNLFED